MGATCPHLIYKIILIKNKKGDDKLIISVFGKDGAGKTTIATHLAKKYSGNNYFTGVISTETRYGSLQRVLGVEVTEKQSLLQAILDPNQASKCFTKVNDNMYVLSMADITTIKDYDTATALLGNQNKQTEEQNKRVEKFIDNVKDVFDILIIDCTDRITDVLTYTFLSKSDKIINVIQSNLDGVAYETAHLMFNDLAIFQNKKINVLNKHMEKIINQSTIEKLLQEQIHMAISYDSVFIELDGKINKKLTKELVAIDQIIHQDNDNKEQKEKQKKGFTLASFSFRKKGDSN